MEKRKLILVFAAGALVALIIAFLAPHLFVPAGPSGGSPPREMTDLPVRTELPDYTPQINSLKQMLSANPNDVATLVQLGNLNYDSFQARVVTYYCREAIRYYERALAIKPGSPDVLTDLGYMYRVNGQPQEAVKRFREAMRLAPGHSKSRLNLGILLFYDLKDEKGALEAFRDYLRVEPDGPQADSVRAQINQIETGAAAKR